MRKRNRRTKVAYEELHDDPTAMFSGCDVILFPNGEPEIWIRPTNGNGYGFKIKAGNGPAGVMVSVDASGIGGAPMHLTGNLSPDYAVFPERGTEQPAFKEVCLVRYHDTDFARAHKAWYEGRGEYPGKETGAAENAAGSEDSTFPELD